MEKIKHVSDLNDIESMWMFIDKPIIHIQASSDNLVPYLVTTKFLKKNVNPDFYAHISVPNKGHSFVFSQKDVLLIIFLTNITKNNSLELFFVI